MRSRKRIELYYYYFKIFPRFWLGKRTIIIHHNQLLFNKFGRILWLINRWRQKCSTVAGLTHHWPRRPGDKVELFWLWKKKLLNNRRNILLFHDELLSKIIARRQLNRQRLLVGVYLQTWSWTALYLLNMHYRGELDIDEGKHVLACFETRNYLNE